MLRINPGPLTSLNSLYYHFAPQIKNIRENYIKGNNADIEFDLRYLVDKKINLTALISFVSLSKKIRDITRKPIKLLINWEPNVLGFLNDVGFFQIVKKLDIFILDENFIGGFVSGRTNPNTKILYFADVNPYEKIFSEGYVDISVFKREFKQKLSPNFMLRCSELFKGLNPKLSNILSNTTLELIVNSLIHAEEIAFVGLQRTSKRITISVCDSGIGFKKSLKNSYPDKFNNLNHPQALVIGSLVQKKEHGLRLAINEVLSTSDIIFEEDLFINKGWVVMSSFDTEIRWQRNNWIYAQSLFDTIDDFNLIPNASYFLNDEATGFSYDDTVKGYWKIYDDFLVGTRVTFELPLS